MRGLEAGFGAYGKSFYIPDLELFNRKENPEAVISGLGEHIKTIWHYPLQFDFVFRAGVYPGIMVLYLMKKQESSDADLKEMKERLKRLK